MPTDAQSPAPALTGSATGTGIGPARRRTGRRLAALAGLALLAAAAYLLTDLVGDAGYALGLRLRALAAIVVVAVAVGCSAVVFHTVTANRILSPGILGIDAVYVLVQTTVVFLTGATAAVVIDAPVLWAGQTAVMVAATVLLFRWLFLGARRDIATTILAGVILGALLRSASALMQRVLDPTAFAVLQDALFARVTAVDPALIGAAGIVLGATLLVVLRILPDLDALALGPATARAIGVDHRRIVLIAIATIAVQIAVATSLVGPIAFLGLIAAHLAYRVTGDGRHAVTLPAAVLVAVVFLVGGQWLLQHVLALNGALGTVIDVVGGVLFIVLVIRKARL